MRIGCQTEDRPMIARVIPLAGYAPADRVLHLVDLENLAAGRFDPDALKAARDRYRMGASPAPHDHIVVAVNPRLAVTAGGLFPGARVRSARGPDGADLELLDHVANTAWIAARYARIFVGSGDHIFESVARRFRRLGITVQVISRRRSLSRALARSSAHVAPLPIPAPRRLDGEVRAA